MSMIDFNYSQYIFKDFLVSPITGYRCKRITHQNIKFFGFLSIQDLHNTYPNFPLQCETTNNLYNIGQIEHR